MTSKMLLLIAALVALVSIPAKGQTPTDMTAFMGLGPMAALPNTAEGKAALSANYTITGGIQTGAIKQPTLLPFAEQQVLALQDAFMTNGNYADLADGLGSTLGAAYIARSHYIDRKHFTSLTELFSNVVAYSYKTSASNSEAAKFFFANGTSNGSKPVSDEARALMKATDWSTDVYGKSYDHPAGTKGADPHGNSRPFQTEPSELRIAGPDYFNVRTDSDAYSYGPIWSYVNSPSYPSGHTTYAYTGALILAFIVPERYQQMITRAAEYGNDRILVGAHYTMDVLAGRTLALFDMAHLLANDPAYVGQTDKGSVPFNDFPAAIGAVRGEVTAALEAACGKPIAECAREDTGRLNNPAANEAFYAATQTYNLPIVYPVNAKGTEDVGALAPEAGYLLTVAFPSLTLDEADRILTETEGPGGGFLDNGSSFGIYSRLDLYAAAGEAAAVTAAGN